MGFEIKRFQGDVDEELICPICSGVLEDPLQAPACEHAFCRACITEWISRQPTCPVDRQAVTASQLRPVPRILRNLLSRLCTSCDNAPHGCNAVLKLDSLASHLVECEYNPKRPMPCEAGCGLVIPKDELAEHNCVRELRALIATQQGKLTDFQQELAEQRLVINEHKRELALLKESEPKDLSEHKDKYLDILMQGIIAQHSGLLSKEPFQHESLLVDRKEKKLSSAEKRLAQRGYELEKKAASAPKPTTAYRTVRTADGSVVQRPVASVRPMQHGARWIPADVWRRQGMTAQEMTLPLDVVIPTNSAEKTNIVLKAGQRVMVLKSPKGIYMQLESGKIIAIKTSLGQKGGDKDNSPIGKKTGSKIIEYRKFRKNIMMRVRLYTCAESPPHSTSALDFRAGEYTSCHTHNTHTEFMRAMRVSNPTMRVLADQMEREEVSRWAASLARARVTRWGGMISTPDDVLQMMIKRSLSESGCPPHIIDDLMENCHERRWPPGLSSLETRQNNRRLYEKYVCKRVPGKQAVLVLQCDNTHVDEHMMTEPGLVMIFAHGIE